MAKLPKNKSPTVEAIYKHYEKVHTNKSPREHLGASVIGQECMRKLWGTFRWCDEESFSGRILRLFDTGNKAETRFIEDLRNIGCTVYDTDDQTGAQWEFKTLGGHFGGSMDAAIKGVREAPKSWAVAEFKTHNAKSFRALVKKGVKDAKPEHYAQMQVYMGLSGMKRAFYLAVNKDDDDMYAEWLHFDKEQYEALLMRAKRIITATEPPVKANKSEKMPPCIWCSIKEQCFGNQLPPAHCRTCLYAEPKVDLQNAEWYCHKHEIFLKFESQIIGCDNHLYIPELLRYVESYDIDYEQDFVAYKMPDGRRFVNYGSTRFPNIEACHYSSKELQHIAPDTIGDETVEAVRTELEGRVTEDFDDDIPF